MTASRRIRIVLAFGLAVLPGLSHGQSVSPGDAGKLIAVLQGSATQFDKARACQQLANIGSKEAVPALAALLGDAELSGYARAGLEAAGDPAAAEALRKAMGSLRGNLVIGVVNSLGVLRDTKSVPTLTRLAGGSDMDLAGAALASLGRIASADAVKALRRALTSGPKDLRPSAADACLACADRLIADGKRESAIGIYAVVRRADMPAHVRMAAVRGLMVAQFASTDSRAQQAALALLAEQLRSADASAVGMALRAARSMPGVEVTKTLASEAAKAAPRTQMGIVAALLERKDGGALQAVETLAGTGSPEVRLAAITALGAVGASSSVPVLLKAVEGPDAESAAAAASLTRLSVDGADAAIVGRLATASAAGRVRLLSVLGSRRAATAADAVLKQAGDADPAVRKAAFAALTSISRPGDLAEIVRLSTGSKDESVVPAAEQAVLATAMKLADPGSRANPLLGVLRSNADAAAKASAARILGQIGGLPALSGVKAALADGDASVRDAALQSLADWPDATATPGLLAVVKSASDPAIRARALRGAIGLAGALAADLPRPSQQLIGWLTEANQAVGADSGDRRAILSALGDLKCAEALAMVQPYLADANVRAEAALAVDRITKAMPGRVDAANLVFVPIFDGTTFAGWEGETSTAFRIEDGAIVGGSLKTPVPRNEFLCTTRPYANFVLRLECRLKSANGGIQFRSQRVPNSAEVSGYQADMDTGGQYWGCLYDESRRGMLVQADQAKLAAVVKKDDWNAYEIRCEGPRIRLFVNGTLTVDYAEKDEGILHSGIIAVQVHGGPPSETWYRKIEIAELP